MQAKVIFQIGVTSSNLFSRILSKILQKTYFLNSIQNDGTILDENHSEKYPVIFPQTFRKISTKICWWNWERFMQEIKITVGMFQDIFTKWLKKISKFSLKKIFRLFLGEFMWLSYQDASRNSPWEPCRVSQDFSWYLPWPKYPKFPVFFLELLPTYLYFLVTSNMPCKRKSFSNVRLFAKLSSDLFSRILPEIPPKTIFKI